MKTILMVLLMALLMISCGDDKNKSENKCTDALGFGKVVCSGNEVCVPETGKCVDKCKDTVCTDDIKCNKNTGKCDKCLSVTCETNEVCEDGVCSDKCENVTCDTKLSCDKFTGACIDKCKGVSCDGGKSCDTESGECK